MSARDDADPAVTAVPVHRTLELLAELYPDRLAVARGEASLTYGELDARANGVARALLASGVRAETPIGVRLDRSPELLAVLLGAFKAGAAALLLDPSWPVARVRETLASTGARLLVTADADAADSAPPPVDVHLDNLAYLVHTSGSTGTPKTVAVTHRALAHRAATHRTCYGIAPSDRTSWLSPPGSSISAVELWPYLTAGASVHVVEPEVATSPAELRDWLVEQGITKAFLTMPVAELALRLAWPRDAALRLVAVGGDAVHAWPPATLPFEVAVEYGAAEANAVTSCLTPPTDRLTSATVAPAEREQRPPIGRPWPDVDVALVDEELRPVAAGEIGELCVAGPELARGYLGDPAATAERFVPDPSGEPGRRMYRTGDLARLRPDGRLVHEGRADRQAKVSGHRVDLVEVEGVLLAHEAVEAAVVAADPDGLAGSRLTAYVVARPPLSPATLAAAAAAALPPYCVPARFVFLDRLPLNAGLKIDRAALAEPEPEPPAAPSLAGDPVEQEIRALWQAVLGGSEPASDDHFFRCGGTSLLAGALVARIRERWQVPLRLRDLIRSPTPAKLARRVAELGVSTPVVAGPPPARVERRP